MNLGKTKKQRIADLAAQVAAVGAKVTTLLNIETNFAALSDEKFDKVISDLNSINEEEVSPIKTHLSRENQRLEEDTDDGADGADSEALVTVRRMLKQGVRKKNTHQDQERASSDLQLRDCLTSFMRIPRLSDVQRELIASMLASFFDLFQWEGFVSQMIQVMGSPKRAETQQAAMDKVSAVWVVTKLRGIHEDFDDALDKARQRVLVYRPGQQSKKKKEDDTSSTDWELYATSKASVVFCHSYDKFSLEEKNFEVWVDGAAMVIKTLELLLERGEVARYNELLPRLAGNASWGMMAMPYRRHELGQLRPRLFPAAVHLVEVDAKFWAKQRSGCSLPIDQKQQKQVLWGWALGCLLDENDLVELAEDDPAQVKKIVALAATLLGLIKTSSFELLLASTDDDDNVLPSAPDHEEGFMKRLNRANMWAPLGWVIELVNGRAKKKYTALGLNDFEKEVYDYAAELEQAAEATKAPVKGGKKTAVGATKSGKASTEPALRPPVLALCWLLSSSLAWGDLYQMDDISDGGTTERRAVCCLKHWSTHPELLTRNETLTLLDAVEQSALLDGCGAYDNQRSWAAVLRMELAVNWLAHSSDPHIINMITSGFDGTVRKLKRGGGLDDDVKKIFTCSEEVAHAPKHLTTWGLTRELGKAGAKEGQRRFLAFVNTLSEYSPDGLWNVIRYCGEEIDAHADKILEIMDKGVSKNRGVRQELSRAAIVELLCRKEVTTTALQTVAKKNSAWGKVLAQLTEALDPLFSGNVGLFDKSRHIHYSGDQFKESGETKEEGERSACVRLQLKTVTNLLQLPDQRPKKTTTKNDVIKATAMKLIDFLIDVVVNQVQPYNGSEVHSTTTESCELYLSAHHGEPLLFLGCALDCLGDLLLYFPEVFSVRGSATPEKFNHFIRAVCLHYSARLPGEVATNGGVLPFLRKLGEFLQKESSLILQISSDSTHLLLSRILDSFELTNQFAESGGEREEYRDQARKPVFLWSMEEDEFEATTFGEERYPSDDQRCLQALIPFLNASAPQCLSNSLQDRCVDFINLIVSMECEERATQQVSREVAERLCKFVASLCHAMKGAADFWIVKDMYPSATEAGGIITDGVPLDLWCRFPQHAKTCFRHGGEPSALKLLEAAEAYDLYDTMDKELDEVDTDPGVKFLVALAVRNLTLEGVLRLTKPQRRSLFHYLDGTFTHQEDSTDANDSDSGDDEEEEDEEEEDFEDFYDEDEEEDDDVGGGERWVRVRGPNAGDPHAAKRQITEEKTRAAAHFADLQRQVQVLEEKEKKEAALVGKKRASGRVSPEKEEEKEEPSKKRRRKK